MIAGAFDAASFHRPLDVGGGSGAYTLAFLKKNPGLRATLFDLECVIPLSKKMSRAENCQDRVTLVAGDFHTNELPQGCDLALLTAIIHCRANGWIAWSMPRSRMD